MPVAAAPSLSRVDPVVAFPRGRQPSDPDHAAPGLVNVNNTGYGSPTLVVTGCDVEAAASGSCQAESRDIRQVTGGFWHDLYKGLSGQNGVRFRMSGPLSASWKPE